MVIFLALIVSAIDLISGMSRLINYMKGVRSGDKFSVLSFWRTVILGQDETRVGLDAEYTNLVVDEPEDMEEVPEAQPPPGGGSVGGESEDRVGIYHCSSIRERGNWGKLLLSLVPEDIVKRR